MTLADQAYAFAADFHGVKVKGSTPTVKFVKELTFAGKSIAGKYRNYRIPIVRWVIWDRIWVVTGTALWSGTVHEMSHALDARRGKDKNESKAEACERAAHNAGRPS